ncbi:ribosome silencing factor [Armatimonas rosea]|uniref:Ribosomal silencing factor RsfS n=1 Tax=Armatimonas rosea TaxID=685828 RepID=A0A7W9ST12_ARMRO|nr:ribosome silencing factor [Armatimonas rosea]MBB6052325.1 ribosome silencing factor RsfS/YbeB/iojap [Armatimonas rosea]
MSNTKTLDSQAKADILLEAIDDRKGHEPVLIDLRDKVNVADFFLIVTATSTPHLRALAENILERSKDEPGMSKPNVQGEASVEWVLMDFGDIVVHLMSEEARERYKLEQFWTTPQPKGALPPMPGTVLAETPQNAWDVEDDDDEDDDEDDALFFASLDTEVEPIDEDDVE